MLASAMKGVNCVLSTPDVAVVPRPGPVIDLPPVAPIITAQDEADRLVEVPLHLLCVKAELPDIVGVLDDGTKGIAAISDAGPFTPKSESAISPDGFISKK
jgi:hypothetical protein